MKKQPTMQQDKIDDIMDNFDFSKVETIMKATNWTWASTNGVPAEHELRKQARELLKVYADIMYQNLVLDMLFLQVDSKQPNIMMVNLNLSSLCPNGTLVISI